MKKVYLFLIALSLGLTSCEGFLDVNTDPNAPSSENITTSMIFPGAEMNIATSYSNFLHTTGAYFAQHYAQLFGTSNYLDFSQFEMSGVRSSGTYDQLYSRGLKNLNIVIEKATAEGDNATLLAATTLRAFAFQLLVDAYGDTPYTESLDAANLTPKFDDGKIVYDGILAELDAALATAAGTVCTNFLFQSSDVAEWEAFAKALKLKLLMRMSAVDPSAQAKLDALVAAGGFPTSDVAFDGIWTDEKGKANPFYQEEFATYFGSTQQNCIANIALTTTMSEVNDARLAKFFAPNEDGDYFGGVSGTHFSGSPDLGAGSFCRPIVTFDKPVTLISMVEIEFFLAEYYAKKSDDTNAKAHYEAAIDASFASVGAAGAADIYGAGKEYAWDAAKATELIGIQKWIALCNINSFESWCEIRRLGYPAFGTAAGDDIYNETSKVYDATAYTAATLYTPIQVNAKLGANTLLQRFQLAESSTSRNPNAPIEKTVKDKVFWAK